jgi:Amino acid permease
VYGTHGFGGALKDLVVVATMLVLFTGGNTSFNGFPYLASFVAADSFLPRRLTRRGHRLAFSNGIIVLAVVAVALVLGTRADLTSLVALYAIGVFTGFTMAGVGMVKHHRVAREPGWRWRQWINGFAGALSALVVLIFAVYKFREGAWLVVVAGPVLYLLLLRLHRQYTGESEELEAEAVQACEAPVLRRHVVIVLVDRLDLATARALQYARTLTPDDLRAVHFAVDPLESSKLEADWSRLGLTRLPLEIIDTPDRRLVRATLELAAEILSRGDTELSILLPRRSFSTRWRRLLHDRTADQIAASVGQLPHANARAFVERAVTRPRARAAPRRPAAPSEAGLEKLSGTTLIADARWRERVRVGGRVRSIRVPTRMGSANLECTLVDSSGSILLVFQGRRRIPGISQGAKLVAQGTVGAWQGRLAILNPDYELIAGPETVEVES